ncbi:hypothetical protein E3G45_004992 [Mycobacteroides abscessus]|uniref:hypothetical protein n=1 Tax=Mycobacteroides abscessus TaxID=36809 RepID=UPI001878BB1F|nr:hypothetical protein [Mycobacteroides abscessus]
MAATTTERPTRDWRNREARPNGKKKYVARRVSEDEHKLLIWYVNAIGSSMSEQLAPVVDDLMVRARQLRADLEKQPGLTQAS